jgi:hypothetical protein
MVPKLDRYNGDAIPEDKEAPSVCAESSEIFFYVFIVCCHENVLSTQTQKQGVLSISARKYSIQNIVKNVTQGEYVCDTHYKEFFCTCFIRICEDFKTKSVGHAR